MTLFLPKVFQTFNAWLTKLASSDSLNAEARAVLAVNATQFAALAPCEAAVNAARQNLADMIALVDAVADDLERDYLLRIFLEAAQDALPNPAEETALDALIDRINGEDERQNALYARFQTLAKALPNAKKPARARRSLAERAEELDDLRQYEDVLAYVYASERIDGLSADDAILETPTALVAQNDGALLELLQGADPKVAAPILTSAAKDALAILDAVEKALDARALGEGEDAIPLEDDELEELRKEASSLVLRSPAILEDVEKLRAFAARRDAFDALLEALTLLFRAKPGETLYPRDAAFYAEERNATLEVAATLAKGQAGRLVKLAATILRARPAEPLVARANAFVHDALNIMKNATRDGEYVEEYVALVAAHVEVGAKETASKLAKALEEELDTISLKPSRLFHKKNAFSTLLKAGDRETIEDFIDTEENEEFQRTLDAELAAFDAIQENASDPEALDSALADVFEDVIAETEVDDPIVAVASILDLARRVDALL